MLLERNQAVVGAIFCALLLVGTFLAITIDRGVIAGGVTVSALFTDAAGLEAGDSVLVAGVRAGSVQSVEVHGEVARAQLRVETEMPSDSRARIILQNFLGKRAVMLEAGGAWDQPLQDGDVIPVGRTSTPVDFPELGDETVRLLRESDVDALQTLITSVADVTEGQHDNVEQLLTGVQRLSNVLSDKREELRDVLVKSEQLVDAFADKDDEIVTIIDEFGSTLDRLARRRNDLERLLEATARSSTATAELVGDERVRLDRVLAELREDLAIVDRHQVDIAHAFAYGGVAFEGFANIARQGELDNPYWGNIFADSLGPLGVDALFGCGGVVDQLFDEVLGPDPRTCDEQDQGGPGEDDGEGGGRAAGARRQREAASFGSLFSRPAAGAHVAARSAEDAR